MRYSIQTKPISYVKAHAAELLDRIARVREPINITQSGKAKAAPVDIRSYEDSQEQLAMLKIMGGAGAELVGEELPNSFDVYSEILGRKPVRSVSEPPQHQKLSQL